MASVTFERTTRHYPGTPTPAVDAIDLTIHDGEFLVLVGPSGCGKTTSLRMLAGLEPVDDGRVLIGDRNVTNVAPKNRDIAMVFQNYALYPQMTVAQNMGFALRNAGVKKSEIAEKVAEAARMLDLTPYLERKPANLSGGQRQRVAMGRALVRSPQVFLMDEPLSNLDALLRVQTRTEITALQRRLGVTTVYVTHDQTEAMTMADRVVVLDGGRIQQVGSPSDLFDRPANLFVAGFIGSPPMNLADARIDHGVAMVGGVEVELSDEVRSIVERDGLVDVRVGFRPEDAELTDPGDGIPVRIDVVEVLGADALIHATTMDGAVEVIVRTDGRQPPLVGATVGVRIASGRTHVFDRATGDRIGAL